MTSLLISKQEFITSNLVRTKKAETVKVSAYYISSMFPSEKKLSDEEQFAILRQRPEFVRDDKL